MSLYTDVVAKIKALADAGSDLLRMQLGATGNEVELYGETEDTGQNWDQSDWLDTIVKGIAEAMASYYGVGAEVTFISGSGTFYNLPYPPKINTAMLSGYDVAVYRDGARLKFVSSNPIAGEYSLSGGGQTIQFSMGSGSVFIVDYRT